MLLKMRPAAIALLSLMAMQSALSEETASMSGKLMLTNEDVRAVAPALEAYTQSRLLDDVWKRPGLAPRDRSIVTLAALIARNQTIEMPFYLSLALDNGVKPREIAEIITHLAFYSGWGNAMSAISVARDVFAMRHVGVDQLPAVSVTLLPLNEAAEAERSKTVQEQFGSPFPGMVQYTTDVLFRDLWLRPDLAPRDRSLVAVSALIANGQTAQLTPHINRAMDNGLTEAEAAEAITHLAFGIFISDFEQGEIRPDLFRKACEFGLEGLVSRHRDRPYQAGRSKHWIKVKNRKHHAFDRVRASFS
jgi:4-carboxymuconolactone decarboxylase